LAPGSVWTVAENLAPTGIRSPDRPARSESLYRVSYPVPLCILAFNEYLNLRNQTNKRTVYNTFYHILLITNLFRSLLRSSSGSVYNSTKNTTNYQIVQVEQLSFIIDISDSPHGHKMSADTSLKTVVPLTQFGSLLYS
jgi:hypothetical protein